MTRHWVVLETGANQDYIFDSNRMRHVVGASQLVLDAGTTWVDEARAALPNARDVAVAQRVSGKAILLVPDEETGQQVIRRVSRRALDEAPGLEITGVVGPGFDPGSPYRPGTVDDPTGPPKDHVAALRRTFTLQGRERAARPARHLRDQYLPWHEPCRETSMPAAGFELFGAYPGDDSWHPAGAATLARSRARRSQATKGRLAALVGEYHDLLPKLVDDLTGDGWIAVVHADGNGVGALLHDFPDRVLAAVGAAQLELADYTGWLLDFSTRLEAVTRDAFVAAVTTAVSAVRRDYPGWQPKGRLLPIVLGGDDVTFACDAALALPLTRAFLREFAVRTRRDDVLARITRGAGLTAAAGVAIVKRHHPFSAAYALAEELTTSAKRDAVRPAGDDAAVCAYDVHIAHESTLRPLGLLRADLLVPGRDGVTIARHGGPYALATDDNETVPPTVDHRDERHLLDLMRLLADGTLSSARAHDLRGALDRGLDEYRSRLTVALARSSREHTLRSDDFDHPRVRRLLDLVGAERSGASGSGTPTPAPFLRLPDALLLHGVLPRSATASPADPPVGTSTDTLAVTP